ncbi:MAG TPA: hypothetical protein VKT99_16040 [Xanthobacteraceae bacterium]|jgi:hypothetical protein|nr:hypothetical protein [Xanthobacteraceae bacterium]
MSVDDDRVRQIINEAIARAGSGGDICCGTIGNAWKALKAQRDVPPKPGETPASLDLELAAAENYMFARWSVCTGTVSRFQMTQLARLYYLSKLFGKKMPTSGNPQSEHDLGVEGWGVRGANEGEADRKRCNPNANPPLWRPADDIMGKRTGYGGSYGT